MKKLFSKRILVYCVGIVILAFGITLNTKTMLGVSPVISVPYNIAQIIHFPLGVMTFIYYAFLILLQYLLLPKDFKLKDLGQILCALLTSACIQLFDNILPVPASWAARIVLLVVAIFLTGVGASITVGMQVVPNPADGLADVIGRKIRKDLGFGKNLLDAVSICVAIVLGLIFAHSLLGIGIGTVVSVILTGRVIALVHGATGRLYRWAEA